MLLYPVVKYYDDSCSIDRIVEFNLENISSISEVIKSENTEWIKELYGWKLSRLRSIANNRLKGIPDFYIL